MEKEVIKQAMAPGAVETIGATLRWILGGFATLLGYVHITSGRRVRAAEKRLQKQIDKKSDAENCKAHRKHIDTVMGNFKDEIKEDIGRIEKAQGEVAKSTHGRLDNILEILAANGKSGKRKD